MAGVTAELAARVPMACEPLDTPVPLCAHIPELRLHDRAVHGGIYKQELCVHQQRGKTKHMNMLMCQYCYLRKKNRIKLSL